jgi:hypothetical protein
MLKASLLECWNTFNAVDTRFCELYPPYCLGCLFDGGLLPRKCLISQDISPITTIERAAGSPNQG